VTPVFIAVAIAYVTMSVALFAYGANLAWFSLVVWRRRTCTPDQPPQTAILPPVTVQLPIYNELYVSERVIEAACALDYPRELLQIQVLDDSTDATTDIISAAVRRAEARGVDIVHLRRDGRDGYKAGALSEGLKTATGEFAAIFDADFVPEPDFLLRTVGHFTDDKVAFVQARWGHLNRDYSWLTRLQSLAIDGHFMVEQACRGVRGYWFNFNGTCGIWRVAAIEDAGGWQAKTLTEDLDLSYRAHLAGWKGHYDEDLVVPGEVPAQMSGFRRQQHRWARGSLECAAKLLPSVWRSDERLGVKYQATVHLCSYGIHLLLFGLTLLYPLVVVAADQYPQFRTLFGLAYPLAMFSLAPSAFFVAGQHRQGRPWWRELHRIVGIAFIGPGLMVNTARAAFEIARRPNPEFERTPKFGIDGSTQSVNTQASWTKKRYQLGLDRIVYVEMMLGLYSLITSWFALARGNLAVSVYAAIFGSGLLAVASLSIWQSLTLHRQRDARAALQRDEDSRLLEPADCVVPTP